MNLLNCVPQGVCRIEHARTVLRVCAGYGRWTIEFSLFSFWVRAAAGIGDGDDDNDGIGFSMLCAAPRSFAQDNDVYEWSQEQQGIILSAFYWGFTITQVPGAMLSQRYGGKYVMMLGILFSAICSILTPIVVRESKLNVAFLSFYTSVWSRLLTDSFVSSESRRLRHKFGTNINRWGRVGGNCDFEKAMIYLSAIIQLQLFFFFHGRIERHPFPRLVRIRNLSTENVIFRAVVHAWQIHFGRCLFSLSFCLTHCKRIISDIFLL